MMIFNTTTYYFVIILVFILLTTACGGGASGDNQVPDNDSGNDGTTYNSGLTGQLFFNSSPQYAYLIDASTGLVKYIPNTNWDEQRERFPSGVSTFLSQARPNNNTEILVVAASCKHARTDPLSPMQSCVLIQDYEGDFTSQFELGDTVDYAKLSPDGQYIAMYRNLNEGSTGHEWLEIYTRDGRLISDKNEEYKNFVWMNNGRIMSKYNRHFAFTKILSTELDYYLSLPDQINGENLIGSYIHNFSISADNTQIAFTLYRINESDNRHGDELFIMDSNGSNIRKLAISTSEDYQFIDDLTWSPDGRWIMVKEGFTPSQDQNVLGTSGYLYAIPTEDMGKVFELSIVDSERSSEVLQFQHDSNLTDSGIIMTTKSLGSVNLEWIP
ncbi:MAG: hypothetical protein ABW170_15115 [Candidatus Thiodiazotropha sp. L084R]